MNKATEIAQRILDEQGYLVMGFAPGPQLLPKVGDVLTRELNTKGGYGQVPGPFMVIGHATIEEYVSQSNKYVGIGIEFARNSAKDYLGFFKLVAE